jgi:hypothetical protein
VAFLERGHGRARAYIERARGALAERQREADELLHRGIEAYDAGDMQSARDLLTRAVADGGANETAQVFLQRLGRLEPTDASATSSAIPDAGIWPTRAPRLLDAPSLRRSPTRAESSPGSSTSWTATIAVCVAVAASILFAAQPIASWLGERPITAPATESRPAEPLPIVRVSEMRLARAMELHRSGRLRDALRQLEDVGLADPLRPQADRLAAAVQHDLLMLVSDAAPQPSPEAPR